MLRRVQALTAGRLSYGQALKLQKLISDRVKEKTIPDTLVIVEHSPVYTVGIRDKSYTKEDENKLISLGAEFFRTNRGGLITFHGPGQLVVYPIIDLRNFNLGIRCYVHALEKTVIDVCGSFGLKATTSSLTGKPSSVSNPQPFMGAPLKRRRSAILFGGKIGFGFIPGVWVDDKKICALGIHASRFVTTHGLALNCNTDLKWFSHIVPCGLEGKFVTSLSEQLKCDIAIEDALPKFKESFSKLLNCEIVDFDNSQELNVLKN